MSRQILVVMLLLFISILIGCTSTKDKDDKAEQTEKPIEIEETNDDKTEQVSEKNKGNKENETSSDTKTVNLKDNLEMNSQVQSAIANSITSGKVENIEKGVVYEVGPQKVKVVTIKNQGDIIVHDAALEEPESVVENADVKVFNLKDLLNKQVAFYYEDKTLNLVTVSLLKNQAIEYQEQNKYSLLIGNNEYLFASNPYDEEIVTTLIFEEIELEKILSGKVFLNSND